MYLSSLLITHVDRMWCSEAHSSLNSNSQIFLIIHLKKIKKKKKEKNAQSLVRSRARWS